jgi:teichuronic acid biosynthesis glycosyltransferase TuaH
MRDLIFISMEDWDEQWRRNQFVCAELARRYPKSKILFLGVPRNLWRYAARGDLATIVRSPVKIVTDFPNITFSRALRVGLERFEWGVQLNQSIARRHVRKLADQLGMDRPILWLNPHWAVHMIGRMNESAVVYDITDDWISRDQPEWLAEQIRRQDEQMCRRADAVIACSKRLIELKEPLAAGKLHWVPNGVDADHYRAVLDDTGPLPPETARWPKPVFGYTGTIHPDRIDLDLLEGVARRLTAGSLVLVGPSHLSQAQTRRLTETSRVILQDAVPYNQIPQYMRAFDACMTPHRLNKFVESLQPIKLWEYLAAGKPIVATGVAGFRDYPRLVRLAHGPEEFCRQLLAAAEEGPLLASARQAIARQHSWKSRVDAIEKILDSVTERTAPDPSPSASSIAH